MAEPTAIVVSVDEKIGDTTFQSGLRSWLITNCRGGWEMSPVMWLPSQGLIRKFITVIFENPKEAMTFKLVFG